MSKTDFKSHTAGFENFKKQSKLEECQNGAKAWAWAFRSPSEFFQFFAATLKTLRTDNEKTFELVQTYQESANTLVALHEKLKDRDEQSSQLMKCLTETQTCLYEERENYKLLISENELLKLEKEDLRRKFNTVLLLTGTSEKDVAHFLQRHPKAIQITDEMMQVRRKIRICSGEKNSNLKMLDPITLSKQVGLLEKQLKETQAVHRESINSLQRTIKLAKEEEAARVEQLQARLTTAIEHLKEKAGLLHTSLVENLQLQRKIILNEEEWLKERKEFMKVLQSGFGVPVAVEKSTLPLSSRISDGRKEESSSQTAYIKQCQRKLSRLETQLIDKENLLLEYKMQTMRFEKEVDRLKEETEEYKKAFNDQTRKLVERNRLLHKRLIETDSRRKLDGAGFRADVRSVKILLSAIDRKLREAVRRGMLEKVSSSQNAANCCVQPLQKERHCVRFKGANTESNHKRSQRRRLPRSNKGHRHHINQVAPPGIIAIRSMKDYEECRQLSKASIEKLLEVAHEKIKFLDQLVKKNA